MSASEDMDKIILSLLEIPNIGRKTVQAFLYACDTVPTDSSKIRQLLMQIRPKLEDNISLNVIDASIDEAESLLTQMKQSGIYVLTGEDIPERVRTIKDPPVILFAKGNLKILQDSSIAVIGTRNPTKEGETIAKKFGKSLALRDYVVVSGLAQGCDTAGHKGCLEADGKTVAVLAHGLDTIYPSTNRGLSKEILLKHGCLLSEYRIGVEPKANQFIDRDRLQSALSQGIIIVETGLKSGTLHTVRFAENQNRPIACWLPSKLNITIPESQKGNWDLIDNKRVFPINNADNLEEFILHIDSVEQGLNDRRGQLNLF